MMEQDQELSAEQAKESFAAGLNGDATETPHPDEPAPEYVQVTKQDWESMMARAAKIDEIAATHTNIRDTAYGKIGRLEAALTELRAANGGGVSDEDMAELEAEYPDLANLAVFKKLKGTGAPAPAAIDSAEIERLVQQRVDPVIQQVDERVERAVETRLLESQFEDWRDVIGVPAKPGDAPPDTEYRKWLKTQPAEYQQEVSNSWKSKVIGGSIEKFRAAQRGANATRDRVNARQSRLEAAVPVRGDGNVQKPSGKSQFQIGLEEG